MVRGIVPNERSTHLTNVVEDINNHSLTQAFYVSKRLPEQNLPINDILRRIQAEVTLKRIRIREFFLDFDGLRKNIVTGEQFRRVLASLNLQLSNNDYKEIVAAYRVYPQGSREERVKWMDFCEDVDLVYTKKGLEKAPLERVPQIGKTVFEPVKHIAVKFTPEEEEAVQELLRNYQTAITSKRAHLKPLFEDFDITKIGYVTKNQFTRILKQFDFVPSDDRLYNLLLKLYMDRGNIDEVNYYQFVRDVDKYHEDGQALSLAHTSQFESFKQQPRTHKAVIRDDVPDGLEDLLNRIRSIVKERRIRVAEFMKDFDKLRHGKITKDKFRLSLNMAKIAISEP